MFQVSRTYGRRSVIIALNWLDSFNVPPCCFLRFFLFSTFVGALLPLFRLFEIRKRTNPCQTFTTVYLKGSCLSGKLFNSILLLQVVDWVNSFDNKDAKKKKKLVWYPNKIFTKRIIFAIISVSLTLSNIYSFLQ